MNTDLVCIHNYDYDGYFNRSKSKWTYCIIKMEEK